MRIAFAELGKIHYSFGYVNEAIKAWIKSHDFSQQEEDLFNTSFQIAQAAFESQNVSYLMKFSAEADARDKQKNPAKTMVIKLLDSVGCLFVDNYKEAAIRLANVSIVDDPQIFKICTPHDIAFYVTLCSLSSLDRKELRQYILSSSQFKNLMEQVPETTDIIENYLNGKYMEFQQALTSI